MIDWRMHAGLWVTAGVLLAGCTSSKPTTFVTVTTTPTPTTPSTSTSVATPSPTPTPTPTHMTQFHGTCDTLLPDGPVLRAIGSSGLPGQDQFVVGTPEAGIGRLAYLNCRYGVTGSGTSATPAIEIGISLYTTAAKAADRVTATINDYTAHGASSSEATVAGLPATMLTGGVGDGYAVPLLVVAAGQRTIAVSIDDSVATGAKAVDDATSLAALALARTAH